MYATIFLSWYRPAPHKVHLSKIQHLSGYLNNHTSTSIKLNTKMPVYDNFNTIEGNWGNLYTGEPEDLPCSCTPTMGKPVLISSFLYYNPMDDLTTGISHTGIIHLLNKTPIKWYSKLQSCVEIAAYGSEYAASCICTDQIFDVNSNLHYLDIPLHMVNGSDASLIFGYKFLVVSYNIMPCRKTSTSVAHP